MSENNKKDVKKSEESEKKDTPKEGTVENDVEKS